MGYTLRQLRGYRDAIDQAERLELLSAAVATRAGQADKKGFTEFRDELLNG
jgi:hypothetical protein